MSRTQLSIALSLLVCTALAGADETPAAPARVHLLAHVELDSQVVRLGDVVDTSRAADALPDELSDIDLFTRTDDSAPTRISRELIELRLRLAGFSSRRVTLSGSNEVLVTKPVTNIDDTTLESLAADNIATQFGLVAGDIRATLLSPVVERWRVQLADARDPRVEVVPHGGGQLGRVTAQCRLFDGTRLLASQSATFLIERRYSVLVATASCDRQTIIDDALVRSELRYLTVAADELKLDQVRGRTLKTAVRAGELLSLRHLDAPSAAATPELVRPRELVRVTATGPGLQVVLRDAEAVEAGRLGDQIRIRNRESGRIIAGRVSGPGEVTISIR
ncbi:MAG: flagellar basal body P-ring formation chaperone FlgA [Planctomycetaceae bacterium]